MRLIGSSRLFQCILIGVGITILLSLIEIAILWLVNPYHALGSNGSPSFAAMLAFLAHMPILWLLPVVELVGGTLIALLIIRPVALRTALREVQQADEHYCKMHTSLPSLVNMYQPPVDYYQHGGPSQLAQSAQSANLSLSDILERQDTHLVILGESGTGKTLALHWYQYIASYRRGMRGRNSRIPIYIPLRDYSLFLATRRPTPHVVEHDAEDQHGNVLVANAEPQPTLFDFLTVSDLPGMQPLRPYLNKWRNQGRLELLCDGLDEVDTKYRTTIGTELASMMRGMRGGSNRIVITCRETEYREQSDLLNVAQEGDLIQTILYPLQLDERREFVEQFIEMQNNSWQYTAGQVMQVLDRSRLRSVCTTPMMLTVLLEDIDDVGLQQMKHLDTRGRLLRAYVTRLMQRGQSGKAQTTEGDVPSQDEVVQLLSYMACAARWFQLRSAISLPIAVEMEEDAQLTKVADALLIWFIEHPAHELFQSNSPPPSYTRDILVPLLRSAKNATLIDITPDGIISFRHELIASYFVAHFFVTHMPANPEQGTLLAPVAEQLMRNADYWIEPVALWAGVLDTPDTPDILVDQFAQLAQQYDTYALQALMLSLLCAGVAWIPPSTGTASVLPISVVDAFKLHVNTPTAREEFVRLFTHYTEYRGQEIYQSLLLLFMVEGSEEVLPLLNTTIVADMLFTYLLDTADVQDYEAQVIRLCRVLSRFGATIVERAVLLSEPSPKKSRRLRTASINILGGTAAASAIEPLIRRLSDTDPFIVERASSALVRLGPDLSLLPVEQELAVPRSAQAAQQFHSGILDILRRFLTEKNGQLPVTPVQYEQILEMLLSLLASKYIAEPNVQQQVREMILWQCQSVEPTDERFAGIIEMLMGRLAAKDDVLARNIMLILQEYGAAATSQIAGWLHMNPPEMMRVRIIGIFQAVHDPDALPVLLNLVADPSALVQQHVVTALDSYLPESIAGLIQLVLSHPDETVAARAAQILGGMGTQVVKPIIETLPEVVPERTYLLVQVLERLHDARSISALISLLNVSQGNVLLTVAIIGALSQFRDTQVIVPLISTLTSPHPHVYEKAIVALSAMGDIALPEILSALDRAEETDITARLERVLLGMHPFPAVQLVEAFGYGSRAQIQHIQTALSTHGLEAARVMVEHLFDSNVRIRNYTQQTLMEMLGAIVVPALLEVLDHDEWRGTITEMLLHYPEAMPPLVTMLGDPDRAEIAAKILPQFGAEVLPALVSGLDDPRLIAQEYSQNIMVTLVERDNTVLPRLIQLFHRELPLRAHEALLEVLTNELASISVPALLDGLDDALLIQDVSEALRRLANKRNMQPVVLEGLLDALRMEERRRGAEIALVKIGEPAVQPVGALITDVDPEVATTARNILSEIGVPALSFIWAAHGDTHNRQRRDAAMHVFRNMETDVIKDALVELLASDKPDDMSMALSLLLERIHDEASLPQARQEMIPVLLDYIQIHDGVRISLRIIALLLLLGGSSVVEHIIMLMYNQEDYPEQLANALLLMGAEAKDMLAELINDVNAPSWLRAHAIELTGLMGATPDVFMAAQSIAHYGLNANRTSLLSPDKLAMSLRALGSLLATGQWDVATLQDLRRTSPDGSPQRELFNVLLGWRYEPYIADLQSDLQNEQEARKREIMALTARIVTEQERIHTLEAQLEHSQREHGIRVDELEQTTQERDDLNERLNRTARKSQALEHQNDDLQRQVALLNLEIHRLRGTNA